MITQPTQLTRPQRRVPLKYIFGILFLVVVSLGAALGYYLLNQNQDIRQQASGAASCGPMNSCLTIGATKRWCNGGNVLTDTACGTGVACSDGTADGQCKSVAKQRCLGGNLVTDNSCPSSLGNGDCVYAGSTRKQGDTFCTQFAIKSIWKCTATNNVGRVEEFQQCAEDEVCHGGSGNNPTRCVKRSEVTYATNANNVSESYVNHCTGIECRSNGVECIALHHCDRLDADGHCDVAQPEIKTGTVNAQEEANASCKCVQLNVLRGTNNSCVTGHINADATGTPYWNNLIGSASVCPNNGCTQQVAASPTPTLQPTPAVTPTPVTVVSPSPTPVVSALPKLTPTPRSQASAAPQIMALVASPTPTPRPTPSPTPGQSFTLQVSTTPTPEPVFLAQATSSSTPEPTPTASVVPSTAPSLAPGQSAQPSPSSTLLAIALGCNDACINNSDCQASNHICVDTTAGRRCRLETNIASETCGSAVVAVTPTSTTTLMTTSTTAPTMLPVAGSADVLKAISIGLTAIVLGALGFFLL